MATIRAVLFDFGMVLSGPQDATAWMEMQRVLGVDEEALQAAYWRYRDAYDRGALTGVAYWESVARHLGRELDAKETADLIAADTALWTQPNLPMIDWAARLQRAGVKTGILSNLGDEMELGIRGRFKWLEAFAHHTFSHRLGIAKPDKAIYRHAAEGLGVAVSDVLFVDDKLENIKGARAVGMVAVQYSGHEAFVEAMRDAGLTWLLEA